MWESPINSMNITQLANALTALSTTELGGAKEASVFFHVAAGATLPAEIIAATGRRAGVTRTRLCNLIDKGLLERKNSSGGRAKYVLTAKGRKLITKVVGEEDWV